jgi:hypothetical protein
VLITCSITVCFITSSKLDPSSLNFLKLPILPDVFIPPKLYGSQEINIYMKELAHCRGNQDDRAPHATLTDHLRSLLIQKLAVIIHASKTPLMTNLWTFEVCNLEDKLKVLTNSRQESRATASRTGCRCPRESGPRMQSGSILIAVCRVKFSTSSSLLLSFTPSESHCASYFIFLTLYLASCIDIYSHPKYQYSFDR